MRTLSFAFLLALTVFGMTPCIGQTDPDHPNILLIISDDLGVDASNGYQDNMRKPVTPTLDSLRQAGLMFKNAWAYPACTPTRAAIMSGKYGIKTGVTDVPGNLGLNDSSLFTHLAKRLNDTYTGAVIGKWHISQPVDYNHPEDHSVDYYEGPFMSGVSDYYDWTRILDGVEYQDSTYATTYFSDAAINWVQAQQQPWFLWLAEVAPHSPYHVPPPGSYSITNVNTNRQKYIAAIEAMDFEIGRLLANIPDSVLQNTMILYIGDNGTPANVIQNYPSDHSKGSLYQGGVHVPFFVSGPLVTRAGEVETALVHAVDIHASVLEMAGHDLPGGLYNSLSFLPLLSDANASSRPYNYTEFEADWAIRDARYKLINFASGVQEFYDLEQDSLEAIDLINMLSTEQEDIKADFEAEAARIRMDWSCRDLIQNGAEAGIDCGGDCEPCEATSISSRQEIPHIRL
ncbi:MAG: sulfatase-like hydrolase/transferase, partial [Bacteroidota bacterium]